MHAWLGAFIFFIASVAGTNAWSKDVSVWVYHNFPPFIVDSQKKQGLSFDLARLLTDKSKGEFQFNVEVLPRERLNQKIAAQDDGIVMWVNNKWFGDPERTKFHWTAAVIHDQNVVISPINSPFEYDDPSSLIGQTLVTVRGHSYPGVDDYIQQGKVQRRELNAEEHLVQYIGSGRGKVAIVANSAARYFVRNLNLTDEIHFSEKAHSSYERYVLIQPQLEPLRKFLQKTIVEIVNKPSWQDITKSYGLAH